MKKIIRSFLGLSAFFIFGLGSLILGFIILPFICLFIKDKEKLLEAYSYVIQSSWIIFIKFMKLTRLIKINIPDIEKLKNIKNSIIVSTHPSFLDVVIILSIIPKTTCYTAPKISKNPFLKRTAESMFLVPDEPLDAIIENACRMLDFGFNVLIFPMGKRHRENEFLKIRKGASLIALKSKKDVIPIQIKTSFPYLQNGQPFYDMGEKTVVYDIILKDKINVSDYFSLNEFDFKKEVTKKIETALYKN